MLGTTGSVKINAAKTVNKTLEADGKQYDEREKTVPTDVEDKLSGNSAAENNPLNQDKLLGIESLNINSKIYKLNNAPSANYLIETNKKYADYHEFLSSDYLLERVKADPEKEPILQAKRISLSLQAVILTSRAAALPVRKARPALLQVATSILPMRMNTTKSSTNPTRNPRVSCHPRLLIFMTTAM